jgi:NAD(P)-dependent dehydrogenase (short-subunit alcohol dehydrogenase family)
VALVTGGARRIGRSISLRLAEAGYAVAIHCRRADEEGEALAAELRATGAPAQIVAAELGDPKAAAGLMEAASALGPVTLLVNNASEFESDTLADLSHELWDLHFGVNLRVPVFLARDLAARLPAGRSGAVVNLVDQRVLRPTPAYFSYSLAKSALLFATRTMAQALAPRVRVNAVGPGPTLRGPRQSEEDFARQRSALPLGDGARPEEIAEAVLFLARSRSITGQMLAVDGGQHLAWETPDVAGITE